MSFNLERVAPYLVAAVVVFILAVTIHDIYRLKQKSLRQENIAVDGWVYSAAENDRECAKAVRQLTIRSLLAAAVGIAYILLPRL